MFSDINIIILLSSNKTVEFSLYVLKTCTRNASKS